MDDELFKAVAALGIAAVLLAVVMVSVVINEPQCPEGSSKKLVRATWYCTIDPVKP
jgi:hypothetical protein